MTAGSCESQCKNKHLYGVKTEKKYCCQQVSYGVKRSIAANEVHFFRTAAVAWIIFFVVQKW